MNLTIHSRCNRWLSLCVLLLTPSTFAEVEKLDGIAAVVNDDVVLLSELNERFNSFKSQLTPAQLRQVPDESVILSQILERLIVESIQLQEAELRGIVIDDEEVNETARNYAAEQSMTIEQLQQALETEGVTYEMFLAEIRRQLTLARVQQIMVNRRLYVSQRDIEDFRKSPYFEELASEEFRIGHILLAIDENAGPDAETRAKDTATFLVNELNGGTPLSGLAVNYSASNTALEGGDLGWRKASQIPSLFSDQILEMDVGEVAEPIQNSLGIHIVQLLEKRGASTTTGESSLVRHILVSPSAIRSEDETLDLVNQLKQRIDAGEDFATLAEEFSDDPSSALAGGDLGWNNGENFVPEFQAAMVEAEIGVVTEPFQTEYGWHILEVQDRRVEDLSEDALNELALRAIYERRFDELLQGWIKEVRDEAFVQILSGTASSEPENASGNIF
ncbi:MAG: peptidylprolyl isomerase [Gammaproteobacteria bacterium]|nr:peptidylprolyl isomerase [Gammaproteobacteria bacterium]